jgi:MYXO-CTERM domain-containing protein
MRRAESKRVMRTVLLVLLLSAGAAHADGWIHCDHDDGGGGCQVGHEPASVGAGLAVLAGVVYALGRKRR